MRVQCKDVFCLLHPVGLLQGSAVVKYIHYGVIIPCIVPVHRSTTAYCDTTVLNWFHALNLHLISDLFKGLSCIDTLSVIVFTLFLCLQVCVYCVYRCMITVFTGVCSLCLQVYVYCVYRCMFTMLVAYTVLGSCLTQQSGRDRSNSALARAKWSKDGI